MLWLDRFIHVSKGGHWKCMGEFINNLYYMRIVHDFQKNTLLHFKRLIIKSHKILCWHTVYPKKYAHGFVVLCFVVVMQSFIMNSHEVFIHIHQGCFAGTGAIVRLPQCQWSKPDGYGKISQCITTTKHSKAKTVCIFLGIYCILRMTDVPYNVRIQKLQQTERKTMSSMYSLQSYSYLFSKLRNTVTR